MTDISSIAAALTSFNALKSIAQTMMGLHDAQALQLKIIEFNGQLIDAQTKIFSVQEERTTLIERVRELEKQIANLEAWEVEKERYELKATRDGAFVYSIKPEAQGTEPPHHICARCYQHRKKSILQREAGSAAHSALARPSMNMCPECKSRTIA